MLSYPDSIPIELMRFVSQIADVLPESSAPGDYWVDEVPIYWMDSECIMGHLYVNGMSNAWEFRPIGNEAPSE